MGVLPCLVIVLFVSNPVCVAGVAEHGEHETAQTGCGLRLFHHFLRLELRIADDWSQLADNLWRDMVNAEGLDVLVSNLQHLLPVVTAHAHQDGDCPHDFLDQDRRRLEGF